MRFSERSPGINFPPLHPWCRCSYTVEVDDWDAWIDHYVSKHGGDSITPPLASFTNRDINYARFDALVKGSENEYSEVYNRISGKRIDARDGTPHSCTFSIPANEEPDDFEVVHYHPTGGTLSFSDIKSLIDSGIHSNMARSDDGWWQIERTPESMDEDFLDAAASYFYDQFDKSGETAKRLFPDSDISKDGSDANIYATALLREKMHEWYNENSADYGFIYRWRSYL